MSDQENRSRITVPHAVLPLPGALDDIPCFHSNSPEIVLQPGVLLSTFPNSGKRHPEAHLDHCLSGRFNVFFHHITDATKTGTAQTLYLGLLVGNASNSQVQLRLCNAVSYATKPDAPFVVLDPVMDNDMGTIYAGPGDRVALDLLRDHRQPGWDEVVTLDAGETKIIYSLPLPASSRLRPLNGRTGTLQIHSDGPVYLASLSAFARAKGLGKHNKPDLSDWLDILDTQPLVHPRDRAPTTPGVTSGQLIYGRVAGIASSSSWRGLITNSPDQDRLTIAPGQTVSYPVSTVFSGTLGTNQVQAAPIIVRYSDTAHQSHGNYGALYELTLPLYNDSDQNTLVGLTFQSPLKDWNNHESLQFYEHPPDSIVFRGTVKFDWETNQLEHRKKLIHLVLKRGQRLNSLIEFSLVPHQLQNVRFSLYYPADCTPPHVLTITANRSG